MVSKSLKETDIEVYNAIKREAKRQAELTELASRLRSLCRRDILGPTEYEKSGKIVRGAP